MIERQKLIFLFLLFTSFSACLPKKQEISDKNEFMEGRWLHGMRTKASLVHCLPLPGFPSFYFQDEQNIKKVPGYFSYEATHKIFLDKECTILGLVNSFQGYYTVKNKIDLTDKTLTGFMMTHTEGNYKVSIHHLTLLNLANLKTGEGLQQGERLCALAEDWVLYQDVSVNSMSCSMGIQSLAVSAAMNVVGFNEQEMKLVIGKDTTGSFVKYPLVLIEQAMKEWYKQP